MAQQTLNIAVAGLGTVGSKVVALLEERKQEIATLCGRSIKIIAVSAKNRDRPRPISIEPYHWCDDPIALTQLGNIDLIVELIGGSEGVALDLCRHAFAADISIVTANKAMLSHHGKTLAEMAEQKKLALKWEAAVAGGVPIIKTIDEALKINRFSSIHGILNGTCNYILSLMSHSEKDFNQAVADAQAKGYGEADPSTDIDGIDTAHKIALLAALAFKIVPNMEGVEIEGIRKITVEDIGFAKELGYAVKLLGVAEKTSQGILQRVYPAMVPLNSSLGRVDGTINKILCESDCAGPIALEGAGAGAAPSASAVIADITDVASGRIGPVFGCPVEKLKQATILSSQHVTSRFYLRLTLKDQIGVLAKITSILRDHNISIEAAQQKERNDVMLLSLTLHETNDMLMRKAVDQIIQENIICAESCLMRIEDIH